MKVILSQISKLMNSLSQAKARYVFDLRLNEHIFLAMVVFTFKCLNILYNSF
jgi:hypothetical protein